jgi:hypothetical protein
VQYATCSLLQGSVRPALTAVKSACKPWAKRASLSIPLWVAAVIHASSASPQRSRTSVRKAWLS